MSTAAPPSSSGPASPDPSGQRTPDVELPALGPLGMARWAWTQLTKMNTALFLLLLLAVIGSRTQAISDRRFAEMRWLSAFFVELLRGLPTLRAFGRSREQAGTLREISDRLRVSTMDVLRSAFQTGLVLDWGGAVAMALVAVQVGYEDAVQPMLEAGAHLAVPRRVPPAELAASLLEQLRR